MSHLSYNPVEYDNSTFPDVTITIDDSASISGSLASKEITVTSPYDVIYYYTTDGTIPTTASFIYTNPFTLQTSTSGEVVSARILAQYIRSLVTSEQDVITASF